MKALMQDMLRSLDFNELVHLKKELSDGSKNMREIVEKRLRELENLHRKNCATCQSDMLPQNVHNFTIIFGPHDFRKKASFCGMDCLEFFIGELKHMQKEVRQ